MRYVLCVILIVAGLVTVLLAKPIVAAVLSIRKKLGRKPSTQPISSYTWPLRCIGALLLFFGITIPKTDPWPWWTTMRKYENRIALIEKGRITQGGVAKVFYQRGAPEGWRMDYEFDANDPATGAVTTYAGSAQGPRRYYAYLKPGDKINVIYHPKDPRFNCEIKYFLNNPNYRYTFKQAQKLHLLDKFRDEYPVEDIHRDKWYEEQWKK